MPTPQGGSEDFEVRETRVMEAELAARHPELRTYAGRSLDGSGRSVVLDVTPMGLHASVRGPGQDWLVDPAYDRRGTTTHLAYEVADAEAPAGVRPKSEPLVPGARGFETLASATSSTSGEASGLDARSLTLAARPSESGDAAARPSGAAQRAGGEVVQRTYRLALLNDPSYADYFGSENVLAEKVTLVNRVNQVYNDDLAVKLLLVDGTDELNLDTEAKASGADGPCGAHPCFDPSSGGAPGLLDYCGPQTIGRTRIVLGQLIGDSAYDIGHLVLGVDGGGVAYLGVAGQDYAAGGCTGLPQPRGDFFYIDYVTHEMGHQLGANHTFNGGRGFCSGNGSRYSVEPGSGSSVMAYAGICGTDDLQPHTDPYFSQKTIEEAGRYISRTDRPNVVEVQNVSLSGFDADGDTVTLGYDGRTTTLTRGAGYTKAGVERALRELVGSDVTVAAWAYDPYLTATDAGVGSGGRPDDSGFQVIFAGSADPEVGGDHTDVPSLTAEGGPGVTATVGETAQGGPARNQGSPSATGNHRPVVHAPKRKTIPVRTPFRLHGSGSDADGDPLTWSWEQNDPGVGTSLLSNSKRFGPLFRIFSDNAQVSERDAYQSPSPGQNETSASPERWFPDLQQVVHGRTNAANGRCPRVSGRPTDRALDCYSEFLPTREYRGSAQVGKRTMHFRLTARDGFVDGGGTGHADVALKLRRKAGPFLVTSQDGGRERGGKKMVVRWKVAHTRPLAKKVRIRLSTDDGRTWDTVLANRTRNDGKAKVRLPKVKTRNAWVMVEARGNYFYDLNDGAFRIR